MRRDFLQHRMSGNPLAKIRQRREFRRQIIQPKRAVSRKIKHKGREDHDETV